jgi:site-specific DNA recombinase
MRRVPTRGVKTIILMASIIEDGGMPGLYMGRWFYNSYSIKLINFVPCAGDRGGGASAPGLQHKIGEAGRSTDAATQKRLIDGLEQCLATWPELKDDEVRKFMLSIVARIQVHADRIEIFLNPICLARWFGRTDGHVEPIAATRSNIEGPRVTLTIPARLKRVGKEMKILIENGSDSASPNTSLVRVLVRAHMIRDRFLADKSLTLDEIAKSVDIVPSYVTRLFRLTLLAPDIVSAILAGKQPPELNARKLLDDTRLPLDWNEQRRSLGFP